MSFLTHSLQIVQVPPFIDLEYQRALDIGTAILLRHVICEMLRAVSAAYAHNHFFPEKALFYLYKKT